MSIAKRHALFTLLSYVEDGLFVTSVVPTRIILIIASTCKYLLYLCGTLYE